MDVPVERAARLGGVGEPAVVLQQQAAQHRQGVPAHEHAVVVETQRRGDQVDEVVDVVDRLPQRVAELPGGDVLERGERRTTGGDGVDVAQQPVRGELQAPLRAPAVELGTHRRTRVRPVRTDPRQRQIAPGELGAPGVDPVEDVDDDVHGLVGAGDALDVDLAVEHVANAEEAVDEIEEARMVLQAGHHRGGSGGEQRGDVGPERVVLHLDRAVELERLGLDVEPQVPERLRIAFEEGGRRAADDAVQRGDALLAVEQQRAGAARRRHAPHRLVRGVGLPHQAANRPGSPCTASASGPRTWSRFQT